jgi:hypothetical protein
MQTIFLPIWTYYLKTLSFISNSSTVYMWNTRGAFDIVLCDRVSQWLAAAWWFSLGTPVSFMNKTDCHDITEILLKVALATLTLTPRRGVLDTTLFDKVCQWLTAGWRFSPVSSTNKTDHFAIAEILLKVALNTITLTNIVQGVDIYKQSKPCYNQQFNNSSLKLLSLKLVFLR